MRLLHISLIVAAVLSAAPGWADECFDTYREPLQRAGKVRSERIMNGDDTVCATILYYVGTKLSDLIEIYDASGTLSGILVLHGATVTNIRQCRSHPVVKSR